MASATTDSQQANCLADPGFRSDGSVATSTSTTTLRGNHHPTPPADDEKSALEASRRNEGQIYDKFRGTLEDGSPEERRESVGLDELEAGPPDENPYDQDFYRHRSLEQERQSHEQSAAQRRSSPESTAQRSERFWSQIYLHSYMVFFSIFGVLARLGLIALTTYPGAPLATTVVWANLGGSLVIGYFREDRMLFRRHWNAARTKAQVARQEGSEAMSTNSHAKEDKEAAKQAFAASKSRIHGFIGLTVGFCGTFTSFADVIRDAFLALSNDLNTAPFSSQTASSSPQARPDGYSVLAVIAVLSIEVCMSLAALSLGAHLGIATHRWAHVLPDISCERFLNMAVIFLGWGCWIGGVMMAIWPPFEEWRGQAVFAVVFAPLGAITRLHVSKLLNPKIASFPLGTFVVNVFGTCVLGMLWDLQHSAPGRALISCQLIQGVADGFCGGVTTVSTWALELKALRTWHAYVYGLLSLSTSLALMVAIMGSLRWTQGFAAPPCLEY